MKLSKVRLINRGLLRSLHHVLIIIISLILVNNNISNAQRSLHHWKRDLEFRLRLYQDQRNEIANIIESAIYSPGRGAPIAGNVRVASNGNVRFSELIVPTGSLILESHIARPTVRLLVDKTQSYVSSKMSELSIVQKQLFDIRRQLDDKRNQFIYKGSRDLPQPQFNHSGIITGTRLFKRVKYANLVESRNISLPQINRTNVNRIIDETYLRTSKVRGILDPQGRLFFEGRKTFYKTVFAGPLRSGCCDRLKPLHTNHMMLRSADQEVLAPIVLQTKQPYIVIRNLDTSQILNQQFALNGMAQYPNTPAPNGLVHLSPPDNLIRLPGLISLHRADQPKALKTIVFKDIVSIHEAQLSNSFSDSRFVIGIDTSGKGGPQAPAGFYFDLSHENYLLRFATTRNNSYEQLVTGTTVLDAYTNFQAGLEAQSVNHLGDFARFVREVLVRTDRPAIIGGQVRFNAMPPSMYVSSQTAYNLPSIMANNLLMLHIHGDLQVGLVNGMRVPQDIVVLPTTSGGGLINSQQLNQMVALKPNDIINVYGSRRFTNQLQLTDLVQVSGLVNGMRLPDTIIPLHLNDFISSVGHSNLWFLNGLSLNQLIIQGGRFDDILLRDVFVDAQSLVMNSVFPRQPDGSILVRAPLRVGNLNLFSNSVGLNQGLLNGFRPQEVVELSRYPFEVMHGRKTFSAQIEASECIFNNINHVSNWTNQLIRIDRPNIIQTIHSRLAFTNPSSYTPMMSGYDENTTNNYYYSPEATAVNIDKFDVDFYQGHNPVHYVNNWKFSPEFYLMHQALMRYEAGANQTGGRYRCQQLNLHRPTAMVNNIALNDIVTLDKPFKFKKQFTMVGKVELIQSSLTANRIQSNYPIDKLDLVQFNNQRIPIYGSRQPIRLNNLVLGQDNKASFVQSRLINGISFKEFANSIMSLTRPQTIDNELVFNAPISFEGPFRTASSLNGIKNFRNFANSLKHAKYSFEDGLQCNAVVLRN